MFTVMLISNHERESAVLKTALEQQGANVIPAQATFSGFSKVLQFFPDIIIIEARVSCFGDVRFIELIRQHRKLSKIVILGIGDQLYPMLKNGLLKRGVTAYLERPLKFAYILRMIQDISKATGHSLQKVPAQSLEGSQENECLLSPSLSRAQKVEMVVSKVSRLLAFPFTVAKALKVVDNDQSGAGELARVIEADPVIATNLLKVANTVFFASANRRIASIADAIVRIGFRETRRIVMGMSVMNIFSKDNRSAGFDRMEFWRHCLATAHLAEHVAQSMRSVPTEEAFLAGLLHDFSIIVLDEFFPEVFSTVLEKTSDGPHRFNDTALHLLGLDPQEFIGKLFQGWKLPESVIEGVCHHRHMGENALSQEVGRMLSLCVGFGDLTAKTLCIGRECDQVIEGIDNQILESVKIPYGLGPAVIDTIKRQIDQFCTFLCMESSGSNDQCALQGYEQKKIAVINSASDAFVPPYLYLLSMGFEVALLPVTTDPEEVDGQFHSCILWAGTGVNHVDLQPFLSIKKMCDEENVSPPPLAPIILVGGKKQEMSSSHSHLSTLPSTFDVRFLLKLVAEGFTSTPVQVAAPVS